MVGTDSRGEDQGLLGPGRHGSVKTHHTVPAVSVHRQAADEASKPSKERPSESSSSKVTRLTEEGPALVTTISQTITLARTWPRASGSTVR